MALNWQFVLIFLAALGCITAAVLTGHLPGSSLVAVALAGLGIHGLTVGSGPSPSPGPTAPSAGDSTPVV